MARKGSSVGQRKVHKVMSEYKKGTLNSGRGGGKVKNRQQAIAIALAEGRRASRGKTKERRARK